MIDLFEVPGFLSPEEAEELRCELQTASGGPATVLATSGDGVLALRARKTTRVAPADGTRERIQGLLQARVAELAERFKRKITAPESPQFLRYDVGDFFVAHQDGNTPMIHDDSRFRKVSAVVFLSRHEEAPSPGSYGGGELVFHGPYNGPMVRVPVAPAPGTLVAFRSETTHEVLPVTHGERYTIAAFFR